MITQAAEQKPTEGEQIDDIDHWMQQEKQKLEDCEELLDRIKKMSNSIKGRTKWRVLQQRITTRRRKEIK